MLYLVWDNSHSWVRGKEVGFTFDIGGDNTASTDSQKGRFTHPLTRPVARCRNSIPFESGARAAFSDLIVEFGPGR